MKYNRDKEYIVRARVNSKQKKKVKKVAKKEGDESKAVRKMIDKYKEGKK